MSHNHIIIQSWLKHRQFDNFLQDHPFYAMDWRKFYKDLPPDFLDIIKDVVHVCPEDALFLKHGGYLGLYVLKHSIKSLPDIPNNSVTLPYMWYAINTQSIDQLSPSQWISGFQSLMNGRFYNDVFSVLVQIPDLLQYFMISSDTLTSDTRYLFEYMAEKRTHSDVYLPEYVEKFLDYFNDRCIIHQFDKNPQLVRDNVRFEFNEHYTTLFRGPEAERVFNGRIPSFAIFDQRLHQLLKWGNYLYGNSMTPVHPVQKHSVYHMDELWTKPLEETNFWKERFQYIDPICHDNISDYYDDFMKRTFQEEQKNCLSLEKMIENIGHYFVSIGWLSSNDIEILIQQTSVIEMAHMLDTLSVSWPVPLPFPVSTIFETLKACRTLDLPIPKSFNDFKNNRMNYATQTSEVMLHL